MSWGWGSGARLQRARSRRPSRSGDRTMQTTDTSETPETMSQPMEPDDGWTADAEWIESPVDDATYDVLMALASKLEAIDTYQTYAMDGNAELWRTLATDERRHAERLV